MTSPTRQHEAAPKTLLTDAVLLSDGRRTDTSWVLVADDVISEIGRGKTYEPFLAEANHIDCNGSYLTPGFIDLHSHGGGGYSYESAPADIKRAMEFHRSHGTTRQVISLVANPVPLLCAQLQRVAALANNHDGILGTHLEGPFLAPSHKGAHHADSLRLPSPEDVTALIAAAETTLRQVTIAPELPGAMAAIERFVAADIRVAVGHTGADHDQAAAAFDVGASILTHTLNAMNGIQARVPGPVPAALARDWVTLEAIADLTHLHDSVLRMLFAAAPGRVALITDAIAAAGAADGDYQLGSLAVQVREGVATLAGSDTIAGSTLTLDAALRNAVTRVGLDLGDAVGALTTTPAAALGLNHRLGKIAPGFVADIVQLDRSLSVQRVWQGGNLVTSA